MKIVYPFLVFIIILISCDTSQRIEYPITEEIIVTDTYFDTEIQDPYRWMEDDKDKKVKRGRINLILLKKIGKAFISNQFSEKKLNEVILSQIRGQS